MQLAVELLASAGAGLASAPHCAAMCGPLAVASCASAEGVSGRAALSYGGGRLAMYALTGAVAGAAGGALVTQLGSDAARNAVAVTLGVSLVLSAWRLLRSGARARPALVTLGRKRAVPWRSFGMGALTGLLPCGALAAGWMIAASTGSAWRGALAMALFALASAPGLGAALLLGRWVPKGEGRRARALAASVLVLAGVWVAARPWVMPARRCHCHHGAATVAMNGFTERTR